jgi:hypothetical protein
MEVSPYKAGGRSSFFFKYHLEDRTWFSLVGADEKWPQG